MANPKVPKTSQAFLEEAHAEAMKQRKEYMADKVPVLIIPNPDTKDKQNAVLVVPKTATIFWLGGFATEKAAKAFCAKNGLPVEAPTPPRGAKRAQEALASSGSAHVAIKTLLGMDPTQAITRVWGDNETFPSIAAKGQALIEAGLDTTPCFLNWSGREDGREDLGQEAAFYALAAVSGSPTTKREIITDLLKGWLAEKRNWHSDGDGLGFRFAIDVKVHRRLDTNPKQEATLGKLGFSLPQAEDRITEGIWARWDHDWQVLLDNAKCSYSSAHVQAEGRGSGWAVPMVAKNGFPYGNMKADLEGLGNPDEPDEDAVNYLEHYFALAQFERLVDETMDNPQATWDSELEHLIEFEIEGVKDEEPKLIRQYALLAPLAQDPVVGTPNDKARLDAIRSRLEAAFGNKAAFTKLADLGAVEAAEPEDQSQFTTILQHRIKFSYQDDYHPEELDEVSQEHVGGLLKEGYNQGELCSVEPDGETEHRGWWSISKE